MPALIDKPEAAEDFATVIKNLAQPPAEPRQVSPAPEKPAHVEKPAEEKPKPEVKVEPPAKTDKPLVEHPPASEEDQVFGTAAAKVKPAAKPEDDFEATLKTETEGMSPKAEAKWVSLRRSERDANEKARKAAEALAEREAAIKDTSASDPKSGELAQRVKELEEQLASAEQDLAVTNVERSKKYRREISEPMGELTKSAEELATRYEVDMKSVTTALEMTDAKERSETLAELAADFNEPDRLDLYSLAKDMDRLRKAGEKLREKAKADLSAIEQEEQEHLNRTEAELADARARAAQTAWETEARAHESLRNNSAAPGWTAELESARRASREHVVGKDPAADGDLIAKGMMLSFSQREAAHFRAKFEESVKREQVLLARIEKDVELEPNLGGNGSGGDDHDDDDVDVSAPLGNLAKLKFGR